MQRAHSHEDGINGIRLAGVAGIEQTNPGGQMVGMPTACSPASACAGAVGDADEDDEPMAEMWTSQHEYRDVLSLVVVATGVPLAGEPVVLQVLWLLAIVAAGFLARRNPDVG